MRKLFLATTCLLGTYSVVNHANAQVIYLHNNPAPVASSSSVSQAWAGKSVTSSPAPVTPAIINDVPKGSQGTDLLNQRALDAAQGKPITTATSVPASISQIPDFGHAIPLSVALTSIIPDGYSVVWSGANKNKPVSWQGGKPWQDTVNDVASQSGYTATISGNIVTIAGNDISGNSVADSSVATPPPVTDIKVQPVAETPVGVVPVGQPKTMAVVGTDAVPAKQVSTSWDVQKTIAGQNNKQPSNVVEPDSNPIYAQGGVHPLQTTRSISSDGDALVPNLKQSQIANMPQVSYAPNGGGDGIYYASTSNDLATVLQIWANVNGWRVQYDANMIYPIEMPLTLHGDFMEVSRTLLRSINAVPKPKYLFYKGNHVLRIFTFDDGS